MTAPVSPRVCPDPWSAIEDHYCGLAAEQDGTVVWWFVGASILAAGAIGAGLVWAVLKWTGWLPPKEKT